VWFKTRAADTSAASEIQMGTGTPSTLAFPIPEKKLELVMVSVWPLVITSTKPLISDMVPSVTTKKFSLNCPISRPFTPPPTATPSPRAMRTATPAGRPLCSAS